MAITTEGSEEPQGGAPVDRDRTEEGWAELGFDGRRRALQAYKALLVRRTDELVDLVHRENGKPHADALIEVVMIVEHLDWAARNAARVLGRRRARSTLALANHAASVEYQPLGVVGVLGPWNYPVFTPLGSIAHALAAGNAVVFKPSELTPAVGCLLADTFADAVGDPPVLQVVTGDGSTGHALCLAGVDKVAFTGSPATGRKVMVDRVYDRFLAKLVERASRVRPGPGADFGPITLPRQLETIRRHLDDAFILREETVGPVLPVVRARDAGQAVELANANPYGLGAAVFASRRAEGIARALRSGMASINSVLTFAGMPSLPYGGVGESGFGSVHGPDGLREFTHPKAVTRQRFPLPFGMQSFDRPGFVLPAVRQAMKLRHGRAPRSPGR
jgi:aldehyde dehydrogenase (NAD+)